MNEEKDKFKILSESAQNIMLNELKVFIPIYINNICYKKDEKYEECGRLINVKKTYKIINKKATNLILVDTDEENNLFFDLLETEKTVERGGSTEEMNKVNKKKLSIINEEEFFKSYYLLLEQDQILFLLGKGTEVKKEDIFLRLHNFINLDAMKLFVNDTEIWCNCYKLHGLFILFFMNEKGYIFSEEQKKFEIGSYNSKKDCFIL